MNYFHDYIFIACCVDFTTVNKTQIYHGRVIRATPAKDNVKVRIHNIRSARPEPEIEILYAVYEEGKNKHY